MWKDKGKCPQCDIALAKPGERRRRARSRELENEHKARSEAHIGLDVQRVREGYLKNRSVGEQLRVLAHVARAKRGVKSRGRVRCEA